MQNLRTTAIRGSSMLRLNDAQTIYRSDMMYELIHILFSLCCAIYRRFIRLTHAQNFNFAYLSTRNCFQQLPTKHNIGISYGMYNWS